MKRNFKIEWSSFEEDVPKFIQINLNKKLIDDLRKSLVVLNKNPFIYRIAILTNAIALDRRKKPTDDFDMDVMLLYVYQSGNIHFFGQDHRDSSIQIESETIVLPKIKERKNKIQGHNDFTNLVNNRKQQLDSIN